MNLSFKHRIALQYLVATGIIVAIVFFTVCTIVEQVVYENIDNDLTYEADMHTREIHINNDSILFTHKEEWEEREHREVQVNPVFVQVMDVHGTLMDKSPNLNEQKLIFDNSKKLGSHFNSMLNGKNIRQAQMPIQFNGELKGYILVAISREASEIVVNRLKNVLLISFPIILIGLYFIFQFVADRNIEPVKKITETAKQITQNNLNKKVALPTNKDELYDLSLSINNLLDRLQSAFARERQFTSDASHELRTPISSVQGTLEVLIRKERKPEEYTEKILFCLTELQKMSYTINQLLLLARIDNQYENQIIEEDFLLNIIEGVRSKYVDFIQDKELHFSIINNTKTEPRSAKFHTTLLFENIISNAIKYTDKGGNVSITIDENPCKYLCKVTDNGIGIKQDDLANIFTPFFRSNALYQKNITGSGIGLSIAMRAANAIKAEIEVESEYGKGTTFKIVLRKS
ncbi:MAG: two-component sensor histidine kinase [Thalassobius sp.]|nr:two-component sensor histidine kinase [Thalassovita sp.]